MTENSGSCWGGESHSPDVCVAALRPDGLRQDDTHPGWRPRTEMATSGQRRANMLFNFVGSTPQSGGTTSSDRLSSELVISTSPFHSPAHTRMHFDRGRALRRQPDGPPKPASPRKSTPEAPLTRPR